MAGHFDPGAHIRYAKAILKEDPDNDQDRLNRRRKEILPSQEHPDNGPIRLTPNAGPSMPCPGAAAIPFQSKGHLMPKSRQRPAKRGTTSLSPMQTGARKPAFDPDHARLPKGPKTGAIAKGGKPMRFPGRAGGR